MRRGLHALLTRARAHRGNLPLRLRGAGHQPADVVKHFVGVKILMRIHPRACFNTGNFETRPGERQNRHAARRTQSDHRHVYLL